MGTYLKISCRHVLCFFGLINAKNIKWIAFNPYNSDQCYPESIEPSFALFGQVILKFMPEKMFVTVFTKGSILEWFTQRKEALSPQIALLSLYSLPF